MLHPLNQSGDEEGCHFENGVVRTPKGFKEAFKAYSRSRLERARRTDANSAAPALPMMVTMAVAEMAQSANQAFAMYPGLTGAAYSALGATGAPWMKEHIVPKMVAGEWTRHDVPDGARLRHRSAPDENARGRAARRHLSSMTGTKIFISGGDHDLTDNIIHMVIAKIPDENGQIHDDLSTVNFFMVPKFIVKEDGTMGARNGVSCGGIEKKMGIKGSCDLRAQFRRCRSPGASGPSPRRRSPARSARLPKA